MEVKGEGAWHQTSAFLFKCDIESNPLRLRLADKSFSLRWPDSLDDNTLFRQDSPDSTSYGLRLQVADQAFQNWHFIHLKFPSLDMLNKFALGAETHLNLRKNDIDAKWKVLTKDDFMRAPAIPDE